MRIFRKEHIYLIVSVLSLSGCYCVDPIMPEYNYYINNMTNYQVVVVSKTQYNNYSSNNVEQYIDTSAIANNSKCELTLIKKGHSPEDTFVEMIFYSVSMDTIKNITQINNSDWICSDSIYVDGGWGYSWTYNFQ